MLAARNARSTDKREQESASSSRNDSFELAVKSSRLPFMVSGVTGINPERFRPIRAPQRMQSTIKGDCLGTDYHEGAARSWRSLRAPDQTLESEDEGIYLRRAQRHLHHRPAEDLEDVQGRFQVRAGRRR